MSQVKNLFASSLSFEGLTKELIHRGESFHPCEKLILLSLLSYAQERVFVFPSLLRLSYETGYPPEEVERCLNSLKEKNILSKPSKNVLIKGYLSSEYNFKPKKIQEWLDKSFFNVSPPPILMRSVKEVLKEEEKTLALPFKSFKKDFEEEPFLLPSFPPSLEVKSLFKELLHSTKPKSFSPSSSFKSSKTPRMSYNMWFLKNGFPDSLYKNPLNLNSWFESQGF